MDRKPYDIVREILKVIEELNTLKDVDAILDKVLEEARAMTMADAGSIFLVEGEALRFRYVHNDTLFTATEASRQIYTDYSLPINKKSIVGYAAMTGEIVNIPDAYRLNGDEPYSFNKNLDQEPGYPPAPCTPGPSDLPEQDGGSCSSSTPRTAKASPSPREYALQYRRSSQLRLGDHSARHHGLARHVRMRRCRDARPKEPGRTCSAWGPTTRRYTSSGPRQGAGRLTIKRRKDTLVWLPCCTTWARWASPTTF
jgi:hypothetical protein